MDEWFYIISGTQQGPVPMAHLREWIATGQLPGDAMVWFDGMASWVPANTIDELNVAPIPTYTPLPYARPRNPPPGGIGNRFFAVFMDNIIVLIAAGLVGFLIGTIINHATPPGPDDDPSGPIAASILLCYYGIAWLYYAGFESSARGATLGKRTMGVRVVNSAGERIGFLRASGRYFAKFLSGFMAIGYIMAMVSDREQALHDLIAGTYVIKAKKPVKNGGFPVIQSQ